MKLHGLKTAVVSFLSGFLWSGIPSVPPKGGTGCGIDPGDLFEKFLVHIFRRLSGWHQSFSAIRRLSTKPLLKISIVSLYCMPLLKCMTVPRKVTVTYCLLTTAIRFLNRLTQPPPLKQAVEVSPPLILPCFPMQAIHMAERFPKNPLYAHLFLRQSHSLKFS